MFGGELVFTGLLILAALMLGEVMFAGVKLKKLNLQADRISTKPEIKQVQQFQQRLRILKNDIERLNRIQEQHPAAFLVMRNFIESLPPVIALTNLDVDVVSRKITFSGSAPTRSTLLQLKDALQKGAAYTDVNFPLANLLRETNIPFTFSFTLKSLP